MKPRILVVDDEPDLLELVDTNFSAVGFAVLFAANGREALRLAMEEAPNLILLDVGLPELDGLEVCKRVRANPNTSNIPILMLTARSDEIDRLLGLELGADDYMTKPFTVRELIWRVKNLLRRQPAAENQGEVIDFGSLQIDKPQRRVTVEGRPLELTAMEFNLMALLAERKGRVQSRNQLLKDVWGCHSLIDTRTIDTHIHQLRTKLGQFATRLDTVRGIGYRFLEE